MIRKVKEFSIGDIVIYDKKRCEIIEFPTRYSVYIKNLEYAPGDFNTAKVSIREIKKKKKVSKKDVKIRYGKRAKKGKI